jgi:3-demethoxyubiquinol 3-hydroxylase
MRKLTRFDHLANEFERGLRILNAPATLQQRPSPAAEVASDALTETERKHAAGLMRVNHAGEIAAQALYFGHAAGVSDPQTKAHMIEAASEEADHLAWCDERLQQLQSRPSWLGPVWYTGAYAMGFVAGKVSKVSALSFVAETEAQVEAHLKHHEAVLPEADHASLAIVRQMRAEERAHGDAALQRGGEAVGALQRWLMAKTADVMRWAAYRI